MFNELLTTIRNQLNERATSPLIGSFVISWCLVNYKLIIVILSSSSFKSKFRYIDENLYANFNENLAHLFFIPLSLALIYLFILPYPAKMVFKFHRKKQLELNEEKKLIEDGELLSLKESKIIKNQITSLTIEKEEKEEELNAEIVRLKDFIKELKGRSQDNESSTSLSLSLNTLDRPKTRIIKLIGDSDEGLKFKKIVELLKEDFQINQTTTEYHVNALLERNFIEHSSLNFDVDIKDNCVYVLTQKGREQYVNSFESIKSFRKNNPQDLDDIIYDDEDKSVLPSFEEKLLFFISENGTLASTDIIRENFGFSAGITQEQINVGISMLKEKGYIFTNDNMLMLSSKGQEYCGSFHIES